MAVAAAAGALYPYDPPAQSAVRTDQPAGTPGAAALRAAIDPETGDLILGAGAAQPAASPDKAVDVELAKMLSRSDEGLEPVTHPDGRVSVYLQGRFMNASVARINAEGKLETLCTEHADEAHDFLDGDVEVDAYGREVR
jgi:hypothetical protein